MTSARYEQEMAALRRSLLRMGGTVEEMLGIVIAALQVYDPDMARRVNAMDEEVDALEKEIDEQCLRILALHQPAAGDLRFVTMSMKLVTDLERMGDLVGNIGDRIIVLAEGERPRAAVDLPQMASLVRDMVRQGLDAFVGGDVGLAQKVMDADKHVDSLHWQIHEAMVTRMTEAAESAPRGVQLILLARHLERVGDHATNIAEEVIFLVRGHDVRHAGNTPEAQ
jgi:phosphate transport system protein